MNKNQYLDDYFKEMLEEEETYNYYFYVMSFVPVTQYLRFQQMAIFLNKHMIISFTNKRILICEMSGLTGKLTENVLTIDLQEVKQISIKEGIMKTKIRIEFLDGSAIKFKPNNICIGLSNHKKHLNKLKELYK